MSRLVRNIGYSVVGQLLLVVLGFVSARYVFAGLGRDVLGIIYFALLVNTVVVAMLELGITTTTVKEVSANHVNDPGYVARLIRSGAFLYWTGYAVAAVVVIVAAPWFVARWIELETVAPATATDLLRILGASALLSLPQTFYVSVLRGIQRMGIPSTVDVAAAVVQQAGTITIISLSGDVYLVAWWIACVSAIRLAIYIAVIAKLFTWTSVVPRFDLEIVRRNRAFALQMIAVSALAMVHMQSDKLAVASPRSTAALLGAYGVATIVFGLAAWRTMPADSRAGLVALLRRGPP